MMINHLELDIAYHAIQLERQGVELTVHTISRVLHRERRYPTGYTTVKTVMDRMVDKGALTRGPKVDKAYTYTIAELHHLFGNHEKIERLKQAIAERASDKMAP